MLHQELRGKGLSYLESPSSFIKKIDSFFLQQSCRMFVQILQKREFLKHINLYVEVKTIILYCSQLNLVLLSQAGLSIVPVSSWPSGVDNSQRTYGRPTNGLFWFCGIQCCPCQCYQTWPQLKWERCHFSVIQVLSFYFGGSKSISVLAKIEHTPRIGILLPKMFWPTVRKECSSDQEKLLKVTNILRSLEQFIQSVKGQNNFW